MKMVQLADALRVLCEDKEKQISRDSYEKLTKTLRRYASNGQYSCTLLIRGDESNMVHINLGFFHGGFTPFVYTGLIDWLNNNNLQHVEEYGTVMPPSRCHTITISWE